jgi:hypothetical protein
MEMVKGDSKKWCMEPFNQYWDLGMGFSIILGLYSNRDIGVVSSLDLHRLWLGNGCGLWSNCGAEFYDWAEFA